MRRRARWLGVLAAFALVVAACGGGDGLTQDEVDQQIADALAGVTTEAPMEAMIRAVVSTSFCNYGTN